MDRDLLKGQLDQGLSLVEIGVLTDRHPSTVGYWVAKYGLEANGRAKHAPRGSLSRDQLEPLVESGSTLKQMAEALDRSQSNVAYWLRKLGLKGRGRPGPVPAVPQARVQAALAQGDSTVLGTCRHHGDGVFVIENSGRVRCRQCRMDRVSARRRKMKEILVEEAGGQCVVCGYDRYIGALHFHHEDRKKKSFALSRKGATIALARLREEAKKCVPLCANCHAEVEAGLLKLRPQDLAD